MSCQKDRMVNRGNNRGVNRLAWLLDDAFCLPGGLRIGIDGIFGLIPVVADFIGTVLSSVIPNTAEWRGISVTVLIRGALNILIETAVGAIPLVGDLFDFPWKTNARDARLMKAAEVRPGNARRCGFLVPILLVGGVFRWWGCWLGGLSRCCCGRWMLLGFERDRADGL